MKSELIKICDKISNNEEISLDEYKVVKSYLYKCNEWKSWNADDVVSEFILDVKLNFDSKKEIKQKEAWLYAHIKRAIQKIAIFDTVWTLNNPAPVSLNGIEIEDLWWQPTDLSREMIDNFVLWIDWLFTPWLERDIYECCIKWNTPVVYIAKEYGKSAEWWRIVKDRVLEKIRNYIENMPQ